MLVEEVPRSFVKKNNNYSHCPLKKRPVHMLDEEVSEVKGESPSIYLFITFPLLSNSSPILSDFSPNPKNFKSKKIKERKKENHLA